MVHGIAMRCLPALVVFAIAVQSLAQTNGGGAPGAAGTAGEQKGQSLSGPRKQLATIVFAGLGGAILGLSTLSFYGRPQEKLNNIAIGFAFGIITGTTYVTFKAATNPQELYGRQAEPIEESASRRAEISQENAPLKFSMTFEF